MIRVEKIRKEFGKNAVALDDINLQIEDSTFIALLGPSGCGKSTTLNCIAGLLEPTSGRIYFDDKDVTDLPPKDRNIGMVFQSYALYPHMKVIDNIAFSLKQRGMKKEERHQKAREIAKMLRIEQYLDRKPSELSGGQQQRVSMARALVKNPKILLLDEPMSNLDARLKIEIRDEIRRIQRKTKVTAILVTHDQEEAINMSDRIGVMHEGVLEQLGTPNEVYYQPRTSYVADFVGNANILHLGSETLAIRTENILMNGEEGCVHEASVVEKSFAGGQLRILFRLPDGQLLTASRYGIDHDLQQDRGRILIISAKMLRGSIPVFSSMMTGNAITVVRDRIRKESAITETGKSGCRNWIFGR